MRPATDPMSPVAAEMSPKLPPPPMCGSGAPVGRSPPLTNEAVEELGPKEGAGAYAVIKASDVMIAVD